MIEIFWRIGALSRILEIGILQICPWYFGESKLSIFVVREKYCTVNSMPRKNFDGIWNSVTQISCDALVLSSECENELKSVIIAPDLKSIEKMLKMRSNEVENIFFFQKECVRAFNRMFCDVLIRYRTYFTTISISPSKFVIFYFLQFQIEFKIVDFQSILKVAPRLFRIL